MFDGLFNMGRIIEFLFGQDDSSMYTHTIGPNYYPIGTTIWEYRRNHGKTNIIDWKIVRIDIIMEKSIDKKTMEETILTYITYDCKSKKVKRKSIINHPSINTVYRSGGCYYSTNKKDVLKAKNEDLSRHYF